MSTLHFHTKQRSRPCRISLLHVKAIQTSEPTGVLFEAYEPLDLAPSLLVGEVLANVSWRVVDVEHSLFFEGNSQDTSITSVSFFQSQSLHSMDSLFSFILQQVKSKSNRGRKSSTSGNSCQRVCERHLDSTIGREHHSGLLRCGKFRILSCQIIHASALYERDYAAQLRPVSTAAEC